MPCATCSIRACAAAPKRVSKAPLLLRVLLFPLGIALVFTALLFQGGTALSPQQVAATPTPDRLAKPTLPAVVTQADTGAQVFWLYCLACHGDRGQGLTAEFRQTYPPDHQNCWSSGCHGTTPYRNGFILPATVPALIGAGALDKFANAAALYGFISSAMPFQAPGTLSSQQYYQIIAFLLRQNGLWDGEGTIDASNAARILISPAAGSPVPAASPSPTTGNPDQATWWILAGLGLVILVLFIIMTRQVKRKG